MRKISTDLKAAHIYCTKQFHLNSDHFSGERRCADQSTGAGR